MWISFAKICSWIWQTIIFPYHRIFTKMFFFFRIFDWRLFTQLTVLATSPSMSDSSKRYPGAYADKDHCAVFLDTSNNYMYFNRLNRDSRIICKMGSAEQLYLYKKLEILGLSTNEKLFLLNISWRFRSVIFCTLLMGIIFFAFWVRKLKIMRKRQKCKCFQGIGNKKLQIPSLVIITFEASWNKYVYGFICRVSV